MMLKVKEVFATIQGEGHQVGTPAVFVRLAGCNLWSGLESTRSKARGVCGKWCDTDFRGGRNYTPEQIIQMVGKLCRGWVAPLIVFSGGEPMLQLNRAPGKLLVDLLLRMGWRVSVETNGTQQVDLPGVGIVVSPKPLTANPQQLDHLVQRVGDTLKVVWPTTLDLDELDGWKFTNRYLQPMDDGDGPPKGKHLEGCIDEAARLGWRVSIQTHKLVGLR